MRDYTKASVKISTSLAALNSGQTIIFSTALTGMMFLAAQGVVKGSSLHALSWVVLTSWYARRDDDGRRSRHGQSARFPTLPPAQLSRYVVVVAHLFKPLADDVTIGTVYRELRQSLIDMDALFNLQSVGLAIKVRSVPRDVRATH